MKTLVILQNAWSPVYAGGRWPRESWLRALHRSRSGQRLRLLKATAGSDVTFEYDNTTEEVAAKVSGVCPPNLEHIRATVARFAPRAVVLCGQQASRAIEQALTPEAVLKVQLFLHVPHPAWKLLTNFLYTAAGCLLAEVAAGSEFCGSVEYRQLVGEVEMYAHPRGGPKLVKRYPCP